MKATQRDFASLASRAARQCKVFFFCGQDEAGASAAAARIAAMLGDAGERVELSGSDVKKDPVLLGDEARSGSLFGGDARHILVRANGDEAHDAVSLILGSGWFSERQCTRGGALRSSKKRGGGRVEGPGAQLFMSRAGFFSRLGG